MVTLTGAPALAPSPVTDRGPAHDAEPLYDVCLVNMPLTDVSRPSLALGLLKSLLAADGLRVKVIYANLQFLDAAGLDDYRVLDSIRIQDVVVDWLFGQSAFPEFEPDHADYFAQLQDRNRSLTSLDPVLIARRLGDLRRRMVGFVDDIAAQVAATGARVVGCTSTFQQHVASLALLRRVKALRPDTVTLMGGANCEAVMGRATHANFPWVDVVVSGEADGVIVPLVRAALAHGSAIPAELVGPGVFVPAHRQHGYGGDGDDVARISFNAMNTLPVPDYQDYFDALPGMIYRSLIHPGLVVETSRGCWWGEKQHCMFCGLNGGGMAYRSKPAEQTLAEIDSLVARYQITSVLTTDNIIERGYFKTVLPALAQSDRNLNLFFETKSNLDDEEVALLASAGVRWIQPGIENLHTAVLRLMKKGATAWQNVRLLRACRQHGVRVAWSIIAGSPEEQDSWYQEVAGWLPLISHLQPRGMSRLRYDRFSPYFNQRDRYGLDLRPARLYRYAYPLDEAHLADQVYFFETADDDGAAGDMRYSPKSEDWRPGVEAVREGVLEWNRLWSETPPDLIATTDGDGLLVRDTRPAAVARLHALGALMTRVLRATDDGPQQQELVARLARTEALAPADVEAALAELQRLKLVIALDGRLLSLVLYHPIIPLPPQDSFPGGWFDPSEGVGP